MPEQQYLNALFIVANGKGGVTKTFFTAMLADYLAYRGLEHDLVDCDGNLTLTKQLPRAVQHSLKPSDGLETLIQRILDCPLTLADFPSNIGEEMTALFDATEYKPALEAINGRLVVFLPMVAHDAGAQDEARRLVTLVKDTASYVLIKNERDGQDFSQFDQSRTGRYLQSLNTPEIVIPRLYDPLRASINADRLTLAQFVGRYWDCKSTNRRLVLEHLNQAQVATKCFRQLVASLDKIAPSILPTAMTARFHTQPVEQPGELVEYFMKAWATRKDAKC